MKTAIIDETWLKFQPMHIVRITKKTHQLSRQMFQKSSIFLTKTFQMTFDYNVILMLHAQCKFHSFAVSCKHKPQYVMALTILQCQRRQRSKLYCSCLSIQSVWRVGFFTRSVCSRLCGRIKVFVKHTHNSISRLFSLYHLLKSCFSTDANIWNHVCGYFNAHYLNKSHNQTLQTLLPVERNLLIKPTQQSAE